MNLSVSIAQDTLGAGIDTFSGFENIIGSRYNDTLIGSDVSNILDGGAGDDVLNGGSASDTATYASAESSVVVNLSLSSAQNTGGAGVDTLVSIERMIGSAYNDTLTGNGLDNIIEGGAGNDLLNGGTGLDTASYWGAGSAVSVNLTLVGAQNTLGAGTDTLIGFENLMGSGYNDTLIGNALSNIIQGGAGNDLMQGGAGTDRVSYLLATSGVIVDLNLTAAQNTLGAGTDTLSGFENMSGSAYNDTLIGDGNGNNIDGSTGNDTIQGGAGNDVMQGGAGTDTVSYADAVSGVTVNIGQSGAQNTLGAGTDTLIGFENILGSGYNDMLTGSSGANTINGGRGADVLTGGLGADIFKFTSIDLDMTADRITDFSVEQGDRLDLKDLLVGYDPVTKAITDFIEMTTSDVNTVVKVDRDGSGTAYGWQQVGTLDNVTGLTDEAALKATGALLV